MNESTGLPTAQHLQNRTKDLPTYLQQMQTQNKTVNQNEFSVQDSKSSTGQSGTGQDNKPNVNQELMDAAEKVEGFLIGFMMKQMRETINRTKGLYERGQAEKIFRSRLDKKLAQQMARSKNFGIAETVYDQYSAPSR